MFVGASVGSLREGLYGTMLSMEKLGSTFRIRYASIPFLVYFVNACF